MQRPSMEVRRSRSALSKLVNSFPGRKAASRLKMTSVGVRRLEEVKVQMFSGESCGRVDKAAMTAATNKTFMA